MPGQSEVVQDRCFLAYNEIGLIVKRGEGTESVIEIEFTDSSRKRVILRDGSDIVVGSLSSEGVILGGVTTEEDGSNKGYFCYYSYSLIVFFYTDLFIHGIHVLHGVLNYQVLSYLT